MWIFIFGFDAKPVFSILKAVIENEIAIERIVEVDNFIGL